jgi:enoyl-CoA hydratase
MVHLERKDAIAVIRIDRPPANAIDLELAMSLERAFVEAESDHETRGIVVTGTGAFFSAGLDLKVVPTYGVDQQRAMVDAINRMVLAAYRSSLPTVAAINGHAIAGGLVAALACDYRVAAEGTAKIGLTESRVAVPYPVAAMAVVQSELAPPAARVLVLVGRNTTPVHACDLGVIDEVVPADRVVARAVEMAEDLGATPREAYGRVKRQLRAATLAQIEGAVESGSDPLLAGWLTAETAPAAAAQLRKPPR